MKPPKQPTDFARSTAKLKRLPPDKMWLQAEIIRLGTLPGWSDVKIVEWLEAEHGIKSSTGALSEFRSWWELRQLLRARQLKVDSKIEELSQDDRYTPEQLFAIGQKMFTMSAIEAEDIKTWFATQRLNLQTREQEIETRKLKLLEAREAKTKEVVNDAKLSPEEKQQRIREILGTE